MYEEKEVLKSHDLDIVGAQFGIKIIERKKGQSDLIELYTEDDENYFYVSSFAAFWLKDLIRVCEQAVLKADTNIVMKVN